MQSVSARSKIRTAGLLAGMAALLLAGMPVPAQYTRTPLRNITGSVTDGGHEPLRGAVVQIEAAGTLVIQSYVTDQRGEYHFRNMSSDTDYTLWATFRGNKSKTFSLSKFDHKLDRQIPLEITLEK